MVDVVDDADLVLGVVVAVQASGVLGQGAPPRDWHREHQGVEPGIVEALADVAAGGKHDPRPFGGEQLVGAPAGSDTHTAEKEDYPGGLLGEDLREGVEVLAALGEHQRVTPIGQLDMHVVGDPPRPLAIGGDPTEDLLDPRVVGQAAGVEAGSSSTRRVAAAVAMTVLPAPGGATRTPVSCSAASSTATRWGSLSAPANRAVIGARRRARR